MRRCVVCGAPTKGLARFTRMHLPPAKAVGPRSRIEVGWDFRYADIPACLGVCCDDLFRVVIESED